MTSNIERADLKEMKISIKQPDLSHKSSKRLESGSKYQLPITMS